MSILCPGAPISDADPLHAWALVTAEAAVADGFRLIQPPVAGKRVLLKPNLVEYSPDAPINTHPVLIATVIDALYRLGAASIVVADGPGHVRDTDLLLHESGLQTQLDAVGRARFVDLNFDSVVRVSLSWANRTASESQGSRLGSQWGSWGPVWALAVSPSGRLIATGSMDGRVRLWDLRSGRLLGESDHGEAVWSVGFLEEGLLVYRAGGSMGWDGWIHLWIPSVKASRRLVQHGGRLATSPRIRKFAAVHSSVNIALHDSDGRVLRWLPEKLEVKDLSFDATGQVLSVAYSNDTVILWNVKTGRQLKRFEGPYSSRVNGDR